MRLKTKYLVLLTLLPMFLLMLKKNDVKGEIPSISNLTTTAGPTTVENKMPNVSDLVKKQIMMQK